MLIRQASIVALAAGSVDSFVHLPSIRVPMPPCASFTTTRSIPTWGSSSMHSFTTTSCLYAAKEGGDGGKKRRRKRKIVTPDEFGPVPVSTPQVITIPLTKADLELEVPSGPIEIDPSAFDAPAELASKIDLKIGIKSGFKFDKSEALALGAYDAKSSSMIMTYNSKSRDLYSSLFLLLLLVVKALKTQ
jgi:hypothetical protein